MATSKLKANLPYIKEQFGAVLGNSSVVVKFICVGLIVGYFLTFSDAAVASVAVTPGRVLPPNFWVWTYLTHSFLETHVWLVLIDMVVVILYGKLLEPLWGALEMIVFFLVVNTSVALVTSMTYFFTYLLVRNPLYLYEVSIHGLAGYLAGFSVAVKQVMPDNVLVNSPFGKLRNKDLPLLLLLLTVLVRVIGGVDGPYPVMFGTGLLVSWVYLRFYQRHSNGNSGDMAESFTFASFFPHSIQPLIGVLSSIVFVMLVKLRVCKKPQRKYDISAPTTITVSLPGTDPADAERRRQVALKALNERLSAAESASWPSLDDGDTTSSSDNTPAEGATSAPLVATHSAKKSKSPAQATLVDVSVVAKESKSLEELPNS